MSPQSYQKVASVYDTFFQWCNEAEHICCDICAGKVIFWKVRSPAIKSIFLFCLCLSWPGCPWITCWDWLHDRGQIKWVLWLAWTATLERNRCCSLAHADVPIAAEARDWQREDATVALGGSCWCWACLWARDAGVGGRGGCKGGEDATERTDHLDHGPQRLAWQSQSEQQWTEDSQSADFPSLAFSLAALQETHAVQQGFQKELQLGFFHQVKGDFFFNSAQRKKNADQKAPKYQK